MYIYICSKTVFLTNGTCVSPFIFDCQGKYWRDRELRRDGANCSSNYSLSLFSILKIFIF